jgi:hypothetical protein
LRRQPCQAGFEASGWLLYFVFLEIAIAIGIAIGARQGKIHLRFWVCPYIDYDTDPDFDFDSDRVAPAGRSSGFAANKRHKGRLCRMFRE